MPKDSPQFDYGRQSARFLELRLRNGLKIWGLTAFIYPPVTFENDSGNGYESTIYPEFTINPDPIGKCKVLLGDKVEGFQLSNFISLGDKVRTEIEVTTDATLNYEQVLEVHYPDGKILNLRVMEPMTMHAFTTSLYRYKCVVT